jgi:hypothetical protein
MQTELAFEDAVGHGLLATDHVLIEPSALARFLEKASA